MNECEKESLLIVLEKNSNIEKLFIIITLLNIKSSKAYLVLVLVPSPTNILTSSKSLNFSDPQCPHL